MGKIDQAFAKAAAIASGHGRSQPQDAPLSRSADAEGRVPATGAVAPPRRSTPRPAAPQPGGRERWDARLQLATQPVSVAAESLRRVRNAILHPPSGEPPRTILISSAVPGEGKSFVCAALGVNLAQGLEQHCLLVDCDLRRPTLASLFGLESGRGLTDYLRGTTPLAPLIVKTSQAKLSVIPSGPVAANPAELLDSTVMEHTIMEMRARYPDRYIFFDSPPALAAAEALVLARHVDAVIVVVRWGRSGREQVKSLVESIGRDRILGVVFNAYQLSGLDRALYKKGYYGYYGYGSYSGEPYSSPAAAGGGAGPAS